VLLRFSCVRSLLPVSLLLTLGLASCASPSAEPGGVRILTLNLLTFAVGPDVDLRTQMAIDLIRQEGPDIVALQEVAESSEVANRAEVIASATGYHFVWTATETDENADYHGGPAVLSRRPIDSQRIVDLPHLDFEGEVIRRAIQITAETPAGVVRFVGNHTTTNSDSQKKTDQVVAGVVGALADETASPLFYAGDFNAEPTSQAMRVLRGEESYEGSTFGFEDAWQTINPSSLGHTYPSRDPARRIDYIYSVAGAEARARVTACRLVLQEPQRGVLASDHLGVLCDFSIEAR